MKIIKNLEQIERLEEENLASFITLMSMVAEVKAEEISADIYSQKRWRERGEYYGNEALFVIVHDGGSLAPFLNWDYMKTRAVRRMTKALEREGLYAESCTCWYTAIYRLPTNTRNEVQE